MISNKTNAFLRLTLLSLASFILCASDTAHAKECLEIAYPDNIVASKSIIPIYEEIYENISECVKFTGMPYKRAGIALENGDIDGNISRAANFIEDTQNVIKIPTPFTTSTIILFARPDVLDAYNTNRYTKMTIGYLASDNYAGMAAARISADTISIRSYEQLVSMLEKKRIDGFVMDKFSHTYMTQINLLNTRKLVRQPIDHIPLHHVLHIKHQDLIPKLDAEFKKFAQDDRFMKAFHVWLKAQDDFFLKYSTTGSKARFPFTSSLSPNEPPLMHKALELIMVDLNVKPREFSIDIINRLDSLKSGYVDFITFSPSWLPDQKPWPGTLFSDPIYDIQDDVVCTTEAAKHIKSHEDLYKNITGTVEGYGYFDQDKLQRANYADENALITALENMEIPCAIVGHLNFAAYKNKTGSPLVATFAHSKGTLNILIDDHLKDILNDINLSIKKHRENNDFQTLMQSYLSLR